MSPAARGWIEMSAEQMLEHTFGSNKPTGMLQAEVDKYASALSLLLAQREGRFPAELFHRLFEGVHFLPQLAEAERARYEEAHRYAARFCRRLEERFLRARRTRPEALLAELRRFYRLGSQSKLRHAAQWS